MKTYLTLAALALGLVLARTPALATDHNNLDEGLPTELEDAYPIEHHGREAQLVFRFDRKDEGDLLLLEPRLEFGFAPDWQGTLHVPFEFGSAGRDGIGDVGLEALYNFNTEGSWLPAFALAGRADFPTADGNRGVDTTAKLILTKSLGSTSLFNQLHLNLAWLHNANPGVEEREHRYRIATGWSVRCGPDTIAIIDYVREQELERDKVSDLLELGLRRQITPRLILSAGVGFGLTKDSPDLRLIAGVQRSF